MVHNIALHFCKRLFSSLGIYEVVQYGAKVQEQNDLPILAPKSEFFNLNSVLLNSLITFKSRICISKNQSTKKKSQSKVQKIHETPHILNNKQQKAIKPKNPKDKNRRNHQSNS